MHNSSNRPIRTAVAILLCELRLRLSNRLLSVLFQISVQKIISRAHEGACRALVSRFVPYRLGINHITRLQITDQHTSTISKQLMCDDKSDKVIIVVDDTYTVVDKIMRTKFFFLFVSEFSSLLSLLRLTYHLVFAESNMLYPNIDLESFHTYLFS